MKSTPLSTKSSIYSPRLLKILLFRGIHAEDGGFSPGWKMPDAAPALFLFPLVRQFNHPPALIHPVVEDRHLIPHRRDVSPQHGTAQGDFPQGQHAAGTPGQSGHKSRPECRIPAESPNFHASYAFFLSARMICCLRGMLCGKYSTFRRMGQVFAVFALRDGNKRAILFPRQLPL